MKSRTSAALVLAVVAGVSGVTAPAHASTAVAVQLWLDASSTCTDGVEVACDVTVGVSYCIERFTGPLLCSAEPVTVPMLGVSDGAGNCLLRVATPLSGGALVVHTQAVGDVALRPAALAIAAGAITFTAVSTNAVLPGAVVGAGFVEGQIFPPVLACEFSSAILYGAMGAVGV